MGVRGLKTFVENNPGLFNNQYLLNNTNLVIDANNLIKVLYENSQNHERRDLFGGDMVQFGRHVGLFFDNLRRCKIEPILVFDGAQTYDQNKSKTAEKHRRALDRFQMVMSINKLGFGDFILPATATNVFRSVAVDKSIEMIQCMYEADAEVARISHECQCPVMSNDSDFFLMDLPYGLITIDLLDYQHVITTDSSSSAIECSLFKQKHFHRYLPDLDIRNLPLLGVLAGNDFIASQVFERICARLPSHRGSPGARSFRKVTNNKRHEKILRILYFITSHSLNETINLVCSQVARDDRKGLKTLIRSNLEVYKIPEKDDFEEELRNLYWRGFSQTYRRSLGNNEKVLITRFNEKMRTLCEWLKRAMEKSVLSYRCLELMNKNIVFIINHMDDPSLPSAHACQHRTTCVLLSLLRSAYREKNFIFLYDRFGRSYSKRRLQALEYLDNFGTLDYTFYDLPELSESIRRSILLATFHSTPETFDYYVSQCYDWFDEDHAEEFMMVKVLFGFIDIENLQVARLWKHFRQATLLCMIYYLHRGGQDRMLNERLDDDYIFGEDNFITQFSNLVKRQKLDKMPVLGKRRKYNCRLMHQITQLQSSIISFNGLNAFLGDVMTRLRTEHWLNSCLIYNLAEGLHDRVFRLPNIPDIVHLRPDD